MASGAGANTYLRAASIDSLAVLSNTTEYDHTFAEWEQQQHGIGGKMEKKIGSGSFGLATRSPTPLPVERSDSMYKRIPTAPQLIGVGDRVTVKGIPLRVAFGGLRP